MPAPRRPAPVRARRRATGHCTRAATARARSACRRLSAAWFARKPTYGRVPQSPVAASDQTVHLGPLTRTVADAALMLRTMAGPHPDDHTSLEAPPADYPRLLNEPPRAPRIAYSPDLGHARVDPEVAELVAKAVQVFESDL